jgi:hypothetical protein
LKGGSGKEAKGSKELVKRGSIERYRYDIILIGDYDTLADGYGWSELCPHDGCTIINFLHV